jgi:uncharacterized protein YidB (DUF937 family)
MTLENITTVTEEITKPAVVSDSEKLLPEVVKFVRMMPGGVNGLLKRFQDRGLGHVATALMSKDGTRMISPQQLVHGLGTQYLEELATASRLDVKVVRKELVLILPQVLEQLTQPRASSKVPAVTA